MVYEMLSGKRAFEGTDRGGMPPSGSQAVDRMLSGCLAINPAARVQRLQKVMLARVQRLQKVMLELKLLSVSAARAAAPAPGRRDPGADDQLRAEIQQVEARMATRLQANERALAEMQRLAAEVLSHDSSSESALRTEMLQLEARVAGRLKANEKVISDMQLAVAEALGREPVPAPDAALREELKQMETRITSRLGQMEQRLEEALQRIERLEQVEPAVPDNTQLEQAVEGIRRQVTELRDLVAEDFVNFEKSLQTQATAIDAARTAMAQTDDLVERVVEALESLQSTVLENSEDRTLAIN
ncbi:putative Serine/threonine protein kinase [Candidatus Sulfopaludibacter sp. SbA3]|nr:putative Serine/threonine protein kinase [Candidatus Sulfopaludibacter sp. SbA3]